MKIAKQIRDAYEDGEELYGKLKTEVRQSLKPKIEERGWFYIDRLKGLESFALKVESGRFPDYTRLEDFFGCTVIVPTFSRVEEAADLITETFEFVERRPKDDGETHKTASDFTFDDLRLYVKWKTASGLRPTDLDGLLFEVQVKTVLQYAWGIATHDLIYKTGEISWPKERIAYQVKAMLEHAELAITEAEQLATTPAVSKQDSRTRDMLRVIEQLRAVWRSPDVLPNDLKRLAENVTTVMHAGEVPVDRLADILAAERRRIGLLPSDLSPYSFVIQALTNHSDLDFEAKFKRKPVRARLVVHDGMDLPPSMFMPHDRIIVLQAASIAAAAEPGP